MLKAWAGPPRPAGQCRCRARAGAAAGVGRSRNVEFLSRSRSSTATVAERGEDEAATHGQALRDVFGDAPQALGSRAMSQKPPTPPCAARRDHPTGWRRCPAASSGPCRARWRARRAGVRGRGENAGAYRARTRRAWWRANRMTAPAAIAQSKAMSESQIIAVVVFSGAWRSCRAALYTGERHSRTRLQTCHQKGRQQRRLARWPVCSMCAGARASCSPCKRRRRQRSTSSPYMK